MSVKLCKLHLFENLLNYGCLENCILQWSCEQIIRISWSCLLHLAELIFTSWIRTCGRQTLSKIIYIDISWSILYLYSICVLHDYAHLSFTSLPWVFQIVCVCVSLCSLVGKQMTASTTKPESLHLLDMLFLLSGFFYSWLVVSTNQQKMGEYSCLLCAGHRCPNFRKPRVRPWCLYRESSQPLCGYTT